MSAVPNIPVGEVIGERLGSVDPSKYPDEIFDLYSIPAFDKGEPEIISGGSIGSSKQIVRPGDVLLSRIVPHIRRAWVVGRESGRRIIASGEWIVFRSDRIDSNYLRFVLLGDRFHAQLMSTVSGVGGSLLRARPIHVAKIKIPLPPLQQQREIAAILCQAESLRTKRHTTLSQVDNLTRCIFLERFGDPRLNKKKWPIRRIGSLISKFHGGASLEPKDFVGSGFPILHKGAIKPNGVITLDLKKKTFATEEYAAANRKCQVDRRFLAVTLRDLVPTGPSIGLVADLRTGPFDEYLLAQGAYGFLLKQEMVVPEYFVYLSNMPTFRHVLRKNSVGSTQIHIRTPIYLDIQIPLPPIELQREFTKQIGTVRQIKAVQQESLVELEKLFSSIRNRAFKGTPL
jgi:type I restriction enzyme S subunit